ncbi:hypothetical protein NDU88_011321 [Pleurodeles waltl]|uniref:Uncharacterized protein n=1 Tax=Pleurodeles waltl TaxID=8319 RepID=A0AAV7QYU8_PLEWA|nr:hypothetical protein NDU88_011321 [Pleurodeles waltl]
MLPLVLNPAQKALAVSTVARLTRHPRGLASGWLSSRVMNSKEVNLVVNALRAGKDGKREEPTPSADLGKPTTSESTNYPEEPRCVLLTPIRALGYSPRLYNRIQRYSQGLRRTQSK